VSCHQISRLSLCQTPPPSASLSPNNNNNNNNNTSICKAHNVSIRAESEAPITANHTVQQTGATKGGLEGAQAPPSLSWGRPAIPPDPMTFCTRWGGGGGIRTPTAYRCLPRLAYRLTVLQFLQIR